jgi:hypothetical protein
MRSLIIALLMFSVATTACSKKSNSVATAPAPTPTPTPTPVDPPVDPSVIDYGLTADNIVTNKTGANYVDMNFGAAAHTGYFQLLHSAFGYMANLSSKYGTSNSYPYETGLTCNNAYLDDLYYNMGFDFADCTEYTDYLDYLADGEIYLQAKLIDATTVEGNIHATILYPPPTYHLTELLIPFRGKVTKTQLDPNRYFLNIQVGSGLLIYTADNKTAPADRYLTLDFGVNEIGQTQLILQP